MNLSWNHLGDRATRTWSWPVVCTSWCRALHSKGWMTRHGWQIVETNQEWSGPQIHKSKKSKEGWGIGKQSANRGLEMGSRAGLISFILADVVLTHAGDCPIVDPGAGTLVKTCWHESLPCLGCKFTVSYRKVRCSFPEIIGSRVEAYLMWRADCVTQKATRNCMKWSMPLCAAFFSLSRLSTKSARVC